MSRPRILLTGASGQVGWELARTLAPLGHVVAPARDVLDLADARSIQRVYRAVAPALVVNAGAHTAVDRAESEPELAHAVNATAPGVLAEEAAREGVPIVHFSTDYVFDGEKGSPYTEDDPAFPLGVYGRTKREGEEAVVGTGGSYLVLRTGWVYGTRGHNFLRTILRLARGRDELRVVDDQIGAPTWSRMLAEGTAAVLSGFRTSRGWNLPLDASGVYHMSAGGSTSWHGFARAILAGDPLRDEHRCREVIPISSGEYPTPAVRPRYTVLSTERAAGVFGVALPDWREQLKLCLE